MRTLKKVLRVLTLTFLLTLAASGAGFLGAFLSNSNRHIDKEIRIERMDKNREEEEDDVQEEKS